MEVKTRILTAFLGAALTASGAAAQAAGPRIVTYGDSLAYGMGYSLRDNFSAVTNLGIIGSGLLAEKKPYGIDDIPPGAVVLVSLGTNDVGWLVGHPQADIDDYARRLADRVLEIKARGDRPVLIGLQAPLRPYDPAGDGHPWSAEYFTRWKDVMKAINKAEQAQARADGFKYCPIKNLGDHAADGLHYTEAGYDRMADRALRKLGMKLPPAP